MGNHRFRLSDMIPNAWFYKLRDMSRTRNQNTNTNKKGISSSSSITTTTTHHKHYQYQYQYSSSHSRNSYYYTPRPNHSYNSTNIPTTSHFPPDPPRNSSRRKRKTIYKPSPKHISTTQPTDHFSLSSSDSHESTQSFNSCRVSSSATDIIIEVNEKLYAKKTENYSGFDSIPEIDLPPIITKPKLASEGRETCSTVSVKSTAPVRKSVSHTTGVKLRANSPKLASKKIQGAARRTYNKSSKSLQKTKKKSFSESFAIVKSSFDPQKDFRESMVEMIIENNIRASKDLEELLACYLSLNSDEYHDLIVKTFEQIWFNLPFADEIYF